MKNYGLSNDKRKTVLLIIFVVSLIAGTYLYPLVNKFLAYVCETVPSLKAFLKGLGISWAFFYPDYCLCNL